MTDVQRLNKILRRVAPPQVLEGQGPWRTIIAQTFGSIEELMEVGASRVQTDEVAGSVPSCSQL